MNILTAYRRTGTILLIWLTMQVGIDCLHAAAPAASASVQAVERTRQAVNVARVHIERGDIDAAEQAILALETRHPGSPQWHLNVAVRLLALADQLAAEAKSNLAQPVINRVRSHLSIATADGSAAGSLVAAASVLEGRIQERYDGDVEAAKAAYARAAAKDPKAKQAADALRRLAASEGRPQ